MDPAGSAAEHAEEVRRAGPGCLAPHFSGRRAAPCTRMSLSLRAVARGGGGTQPDGAPPRGKGVARDRLTARIKKEKAEKCHV